MYKGVSPTCMWTSCVHVLVNRSITLLCMFKYDSIFIGASYETYSSHSMQVRVQEHVDRYALVVLKSIHMH